MDGSSGCALGSSLTVDAGRSLPTTGNVCGAATRVTAASRVSGDPTHCVGSEGSRAPQVPQADQMMVGTWSQGILVSHGLSAIKVLSNGRAESIWQIIGTRSWKLGALCSRVERELWTPPSGPLVMTRSCQSWRLLPRLGQPLPPGAGGGWEVLHQEPGEWVA